MVRGGRLRLLPETPRFQHPFPSPKPLHRIGKVKVTLVEIECCGPPSTFHALDTMGSRPLPLPARMSESAFRQLLFFQWLRCFKLFNSLAAVTVNSRNFIKKGFKTPKGIRTGNILNYCSTSQRRAPRLRCLQQPCETNDSSSLWEVSHLSYVIWAEKTCCQLRLSLWISSSINFQTRAARLVSELSDDV